MEYLIPALFLFLLMAVIGLLLRGPRQRTAARAGGAVNRAGRPAPALASHYTPVVIPRPVLTVAPPPRALWDERGWQRWRKDGTTLYVGEYRVHERKSRQVRRFPGYIRIRGHEIETYIASLPPAVRHHPKGPCFQYVDDPWFRLHWHRPPRNADEAILYVEQVLHEAINDTGPDR